MSIDPVFLNSPEQTALRRRDHVNRARVATAIAEAIGTGAPGLGALVLSTPDCFMTEILLGGACGKTSAVNLVPSGDRRLVADGGLGIPIVEIRPARIDPADMNQTSEAVGRIAADLFADRDLVFGVVSVPDGIDDHSLSLLRLLASAAADSPTATARLVLVTRADAAATAGLIRAAGVEFSFVQTMGR